MARDESVVVGAREGIVNSGAVSPDDDEVMMSGIMLGAPADKVDQIVGVGGIGGPEGLNEIVVDGGVRVPALKMKPLALIHGAGVELGEHVDVVV